MSKPPLACLLLLSAVLPACNNSRDNTNPFANAAQTTSPPSSAALLFTSGVWALQAGAPREVYAVNLDGSGLTRLTFCNNATLGSTCDQAEASPAPDRVRVMVRRASVDTNQDGLVTEADGTALVFVDLRRGVEAQLVPASRRVSGVDWGPSGDIAVYSALPTSGGNEDLFRIDYNGQNDTDLSCPSGAPCDASVRERRPRIDPSESFAVFQRLDATGQSQVAIFSSFATQPVLTTGPQDADPSFSPDGRRVAFRRLTDAAANGGAGNWDIMTIGIDGAGLALVASGPAFRAAPDWGANGIAWAESDAAGERLVVSAADGSGSRVLVTQPAGVALTNPRWLPAP